MAKPNMKSKRMIGLLIAVSVLVLSLAASGAYARYIKYKDAYGNISTPHFYFESDVLTKEGEHYSVNPGTKSLKFTLKNYADDLRLSDIDINYTVTVTEEGSAQTAATLSETSGVLVKSVTSSETITLSGLENGKTYTVKAQTVGGEGKEVYEKTISATFTVEDAKKAVYKHTEVADHYILLTVWTDDAVGALNVAFPSGVIPDSTDAIMKDVDNYEDSEYKAGSFEDSTSFAEKNYSSYVYRFFKTEAYSEGAEFTVTLKVSASETLTAEETALKQKE